jgi:hypothetical protein
MRHPSIREPHVQASGCICIRLQRDKSKVSPALLYVGQTAGFVSVARACLQGR